MNGPAGLNGLVAFALGDINGDGVIDVVTLDGKGTIRRDRVAAMTGISRRWRHGPTSQPAPGPACIDSFSRTSITTDHLIWWRRAPGDRESAFERRRNISAARPRLRRPKCFSVVDLNDDGQLDLVGCRIAGPLVGSGKAQRTITGKCSGRAHRRRPATSGSTRSASAARLEIRSGLLTQKQSIAGSSVHFGLGTRTGIDVAASSGPNGVVQADFDRGANQVVVAEQRLKGSCPWVFTYDGQRDALRHRLFVAIAAWAPHQRQDTAGVSQTEDWVRIRADQLVPRDGSVRCADHRGAVGDAFRGSRRADDG